MNKKNEQSSKDRPVVELDAAHGGVVKVKALQLQREDVREARELEPLYYERRKNNKNSNKSKKKGNEEEATNRKQQTLTQIACTLITAFFFFFIHSFFFLFVVQTTDLEGVALLVALGALVLVVALQSLGLDELAKCFLYTGHGLLGPKRTQHQRNVQILVLREEGI